MLITLQITCGLQHLFLAKGTQSSATQLNANMTNMNSIRINGGDTEYIPVLLGGVKYYLYFDTEHVNGIQWIGRTISKREIVAYYLSNSRICEVTIVD